MISSTKKRTNVRPHRPPPALRAARAALGLLERTSPAFAAVYAERLFRSARRHTRPAWEVEALASARPVRVPYDGAFVPAWSWDVPGVHDAPTALLVHGWEGRGSQLSAFVAPLVGLGLRVVAFDAPGHGDAPARFGSLVDHARAVRAVADAVAGGRVDLVVGHSMGSAAALFAMRYGFDAGAFALVAPPVSPASWVTTFEKMLGLSPQTREAMVRRIERRYDIAMDSLDARIDAARIDAPVLVVHDEDDREVPFAEGEIIASIARDARFVPTRGLGHRRILRAPEVVREVEAFAAAFAVPRDLAASGAHRRVSWSLDDELFFRDLRHAG